MFTSTFATYPVDFHKDIPVHRLDTATRRPETVEHAARFDEFLLENHNRPLEEAAQTALQYLADATGFFVAGLYLPNEETNSLVFSAGYNHDADTADHKPIPYGVGLLGQVARTKHEVCFTDASQQISVRSSLINVPTVTYWLRPLVFNGQLAGVLEMGFTRSLEVQQRISLQPLFRSLATFLASSLTASKFRNLAGELQRTHADLEMSRTQLQAQMHELAAERRRLESTLEGCVDGVLCFDGQGRVTFVNAATEEILSLSRNQILNTTVQELLGMKIEDRTTVTLPNGNIFPTRRRIEIDVALNRNAPLSLLATLATDTQQQDTQTHFTLFFQQVAVEMF